MSRFLQRQRAKAAAAPAAAPKTNAEALALIEQLKRQNAELQTRSARDVAAANDRAAKAQREAEAAAEERRLARIRDGIVRAAKAAGAIDEEDVADLVMTRAKFALGDDGRVTLADKPDVDAAAHVASFLESRHHLARARTAAGSGASTAPQAPAAAPPPPQYDPKTSQGLTQHLRDRLLSRATPQPTGAPAPAAPGRGTGN